MCSSLALTVSLWVSAVALFVLLVLQVLFPFALWTFQKECSEGGGKGFSLISQEGRGLEKVSNTSPMVNQAKAPLL